MKTLTEFEIISKTVAEYKAMNLQVHAIYPHMTGIAAAHPIDSGILQHIHFNEDIRKAITEAGKKRLAELILELNAYGIDVEYSSKDIGR